MLTELEIKVLEDLRSIGGEATTEDSEGNEMKLVYLDNGIDTEDKSVRGVLGSLEKKGYYMKEDGFAFGWVRV